MRILHFSDIHAGGWIVEPGGYFDKRLLGALNYCLRRRKHHDWRYVPALVDRIKAESPDLVICTGDLVSIAEAREFTQAQRALQPLVDDKSLEFVYVPGNHDKYVASQTAERCLREAFYTLNRERWQLEDLPIRLEMEQAELLLFDQARPQPWFVAAGAMSDEDILWAQEALGSCHRPVITAAHYPLFDSSGAPLHDKRACANCGYLQESLDNGTIKLALCGHNHHPFVRRHDGGGVEVCAGSTTMVGQLNAINLSNDGRVEQNWLELTLV